LIGAGGNYVEIKRWRIRVGWIRLAASHSSLCISISIGCTTTAARPSWSWWMDDGRRGGRTATVIWRERYGGNGGKDVDPVSRQIFDDESASMSASSASSVGGGGNQIHKDTIIMATKIFLSIPAMVASAFIGLVVIGSGSSNDSGGCCVHAFQPPAARPRRMYHRSIAMSSSSKLGMAPRYDTESQMWYVTDPEVRKLKPIIHLGCIVHFLQA